MSVKVVTVGAGGYATTYVHPLLDDMHKGIYEYAGVIETNIENSPYVQRIHDENIPVCKTLDEYFAKGYEADLVIIAIPTHFHKDTAITAVNHGADVLCEKPAAPLYSDVLQMISASEQTGKFIGIGYQWSYSAAIRSLKTQILSGELGKPLEMKSFVSWPRPISYYEGSTWKGKIKDEDGNFILDSVVGNATAHYLHNMYFLLGEEMNTCDFPSIIRCELLRGNKITNFDTCLLDIKTEKGVKLFFAASHVTDRNEDPKFCFTFENAVVTFNMGGEKDHIIAKFNDGTIVDYGNPNDAINTRVWEAIDSVKSRKPLVCMAHTASAHTLTVDSLYTNGEIIDFPEQITKTIDEKQIVVDGLYETMYKAYENGKLLSDFGVSYVKAKQFNVKK